MDSNLSVFVADVHVAAGGIKTKWGLQPTYQNEFFERTVDEILAMRPRPARVVCFGDVALWFGFDEDYAVSAPMFRRFADAGIEVVLTMGNHDHRMPFLRRYPEYAKSSPVPGRVVSIVDLGSCDLILLDSLQERGGNGGDDNAVDGAIDELQWNWLARECMRRPRPFLCGAHHPPKELRRVVDGRETNVLSLLVDAPMYCGWVNGHNHSWRRDYHFQNYGSRRVFRDVVLPSTGWSGDIGYAIMRTYADRAELSVVEKDFFFPTPLAATEERPAQWDKIVAENRGGHVTFCF